ncbi:Crp/Fnr family transcriptional regulator [Sphingobacterium sp. CZ-2]|uniref:Crp/Fnr family transcriptional regulator n=1 Tax=Sphingobacterium sp. CZ-2 TaxID=2557994 RepID=UPI00106F8414|nr:Crp/Fnr family transcriptional regulator [Sphingobacterium sp. CZ-2]QBR12579.1 Crp/Fnr family transcriptional regulator [Sphingobacterium sp. CZ-2]
MIADVFDFLTEAGLREELEEKGVHLKMPVGKIVVEPNKYIKVIPLVIKGTVKVIRQTENGNELFIYYIQAGESCAVSLSTTLMDKLSNIKAIVEEDVELIAVTSSLSREWFEKYASWRMFVLKTMDHRYDEIINALDNVAFKKIEERLLEHLKSKAEIMQTTTLILTHQEIAMELSTSREVVSRLLKAFEQRGLIRLSRNKIDIL